MLDPLSDNIRLHSYPASRLANAAGLWGLLWGMLMPAISNTPPLPYP